MAEEFPRYTPESSDDSSSDSGGKERVERRATPEAPPPAPKQEEGTIFSRSELAPSLSRPLFEFIRKQEQPEAQAEFPPLTPESLPSVSVPSDPEVRTYQPPVEAEAAAHAQQEALAEDDDDEEDTGRSAAPAAAPAAQAAPHQPAPQPQEAQRPLRDQFEDIMRTEMGEDFTRLTSGDQLGAAEHTPVPSTEEEPVAATAMAGSTIVGAARPYAAGPPAAEYRSPVAEAASEAAEDPAPPASAGGGTPPRSPGENAGFYYNEDEPDEPDVQPVRTAASVAGTPPPRGFGNAGGGFGGAGGQSGPNMGGASRFAGGINPNALIPKVEMQKNHNGRWFVAGVITGWLIKQHFANKELAKVRGEGAQRAEQQDQKLSTMAYEQQTMQRQLKSNEGRFQEIQAAEAARANQARHRAAEQQPGSAAEQTPPPAAPAIEAPLQHPGAGEAVAVAAAAEAAAVAAAPAAKEAAPANSPFTPEAAKAAETAERTAQAIQQATAQELVEKAYELQKGQHVEHATGGGHDIIVDSHGHEVQGAMNYAAEFQSQQHREQGRVTSFGSGSSSTGPASSAGGVGDGAAPAPSAIDSQAYSIVTGLGSGQVDPSHSLPGGPPSMAQRQHLLSGKKDNPLAATLTSPWLWAAIIVLLAAFFIAAFI